MLFFRFLFLFPVYIHAAVAAAVPRFNETVGHDLTRRVDGKFGEWLKTFSEKPIVKSSVWSNIGAIAGGICAVFSAVTFGEDIAKRIIAHNTAKKIQQEEFTKKLLAHKVCENPGRNVVIYHDKKSKFNGKNVVYETEKLGRRKYHVRIFDDGDFTLHGDGGYSNWAVYGHYRRRAHFVEFFQFEEPRNEDMCRACRDEWTP